MSILTTLMCGTVRPRPNQIQYIKINHAIEEKLEGKQDNIKDKNAKIENSIT